MDKKTLAFYESLTEKLNDTTTWPAEYLYKFIVPTDDMKVVAIENAFDNLGAIIETRQSKTGKFTSISVNVTMQNAQEIIQKYIEVSIIEGIISL
jgi:uncharacterized protein